MRCSLCKDERSALDGHPVCLPCSGCTADSTCPVCVEWTETAWAAILSFYAETHPTQPKSKKTTASATVTASSEEKVPDEEAAQSSSPAQDSDSGDEQASSPSRSLNRESQSADAEHVERASSQEREPRYVRTLTVDKPPPSTASKVVKVVPSSQRRHRRKSASPRRSPSLRRSPAPRRHESPRRRARSPSRRRRPSHDARHDARSRRTSRSPRRRTPPSSPRGRSRHRRPADRRRPSPNEDHYRELWDWDRQPNGGDAPVDRLPIQYQEAARRQHRSPRRDRSPSRPRSRSHSTSSRDSRGGDRASYGSSDGEGDDEARRAKVVDFKKATRAICEALPQAESRPKDGQDIAGPGVDIDDLRHRAKPTALNQPPAFRSASAALNAQLKSSSKGHLFSASTLPKEMNATFKADWYSAPDQYFSCTKPTPDQDMSLFAGQNKTGKRVPELVEKTSVLTRNTLAITGFLDWASQAICKLASQGRSRTRLRDIQRIATVANRAAYQGACQAMAATANLDLARRDALLENCPLLPDPAKDSLRTAALGGKSVFGRRQVKRITKKFPTAFVKRSTRGGRGRSRPFRGGRGQQGQQSRPSYQANDNTSTSTPRRGGGRGRGRGRGRAGKQ